MPNEDDWGAVASLHMAPPSDQTRDRDKRMFARPNLHKTTADLGARGETNKTEKRGHLQNSTLLFLFLFVIFLVLASPAPLSPQNLSWRMNKRGNISLVCTNNNRNNDLAEKEGARERLLLFSPPLSFPPSTKVLLLCLSLD